MYYLFLLTLRVSSISQTSPENLQLASELCHRGVFVSGISATIKSDVKQIVVTVLATRVRNDGKGSRLINQGQRWGVESIGGVVEVGHHNPIASKRTNTAAQQLPQGFPLELSRIIRQHRIEEGQLASWIPMEFRKRQQRHPEYIWNCHYWNTQDHPKSLVHVVYSVASDVLGVAETRELGDPYP
jgi:hypothetical protein